MRLICSEVAMWETWASSRLPAAHILEARFLLSEVPSEAITQPAGSSMIARRQWRVKVEKGKPRAELSLVLHTIEVLGISLATCDSSHQEDRLHPNAIDIDRIVNAAREKRK